MYANDSKGKTVTGTLMAIEEDPNSRYRFHIWFDYTRETMNTVSEGAMVAVPNFYMDPSDAQRQWSSILEVSTLLPVHYAIGSTESGFPGFLEEAARSAGQDWVEQENQSTDDTTKIRCVGIPTNLMIDESENVREEQGLPMVGHSARLLDSKTTEKIANIGIDLQHDRTTKVGPLIRDEKVSIYLRTEDVLRTHFAVFGYTGAGKSNLLSTMIAKFLAQPSAEPATKLVILDLMGEFSVLLMDLLVEIPSARLVAIGPESLPDSVLGYYAEPKGPSRDALSAPAARDLARTSLYPKRLKPVADRFESAWEALLREDKIRVWQEHDPTIGEFVGTVRSEVTGGNMGGAKQEVFQLLEDLESKFASTAFSAQKVLDALNMIAAVRGRVSVSTAISNLTQLEKRIKVEAAAGRPTAPPACRVTVPGIAKALNEPGQAPLTVVQASDPDRLRQFAFYIGNAVYELRRGSGQISPLVSFIFDEADEFIPLTPDRESSQAASTAISMTLARRGRKFGLGLGIATQRVTYLNTSIMAQPHTYFISKLPRRSDRERVCEAFGISEEMFRQTFKFKKGNWLLVSHDATGLESVPLPVKTENADQRVLDWLETHARKAKGPVA